MFITKIQISNIKAFKQNVEFDLNHNPSKIEKEINQGNFKFVNDQLFTPIISIIAANAKGKTTTIQTIHDFFTYLKPEADWMNLSLQIDDLIHKYFPLSTNSINNEIHNVLINSLPRQIYSLRPQFSKTEANELFLKLSKQTSNIDSDKFYEFLNEFSFVIFQSKLKKWLKNKHEKNEDSYIKLYFYDSNLGRFSVELKDNVKENTWGYYFYDSKDSLLSQYSKYMDELLKLSNNITYFNSEYNSQTTLDFNNPLVNMKHANFILMSLVNEIGETKLNETLRMIDNNIKEVSYLKNDSGEYQKINFIINLDNSTIDPNDLSSGTKRFLHLLYCFIMAFKQKNGLVIVDEYDTYLHIAITDFFKEYVNSSPNEIQFIYTSHNPIVAVRSLSRKQVFLINEDEGDIWVEKLSSVAKGNNSGIKMLSEGKIGSNPNAFEIRRIVNSLIFK